MKFLLACFLITCPIAVATEVKVLVGTYLGDFQRNYYGNKAPSSLRTVWSCPLGTGKTFFKERINLMSGAGWTGQPLLFQENGRLIIIQVSLDYHLRKIDAASGKIIWQSKLGDAIKGTPTFFDRGHGDDATRRVLITGSRHGFGINLRQDPAYSLRGISFDDGREFWRHDTVLTDSNSRDCDASAVTVGEMAAVPLENGKFTIFSPDPLKATAAGGFHFPRVKHESMLYRKSDLSCYVNEFSCESSPTLLGQTAYIAAGCGRIYAKSTSSGFTYWSLDVGGDLESTMPITDDGCLLLGIEKQFISGHGGVMKINPQKRGNEAVEWFLPWPNVAFYEWQGGIVGSPTLNARYGSTAPGMGKLACAVGVDGLLRVFDQSQISAQRSLGPREDQSFAQPVITDEVKLPSGTISTPIFVNDKILVGYDSGLDLYQVSPLGKLKRLDRISGKMFDATPIVWNGRAYIASRDGNLYCFE
jgi:outer membrane protein assembly factor BamB